MTVNESGKEETFDEFLEAALSDEYVGRCKVCGHIQYGCEPDAEGYECEECGKKAVDGALYALM